MSNVDLDAILDISLDDLEDLPEFKPFPAGTHLIKASFESKVVNDKPAVEFRMTMIETQEYTVEVDDAAKCKEGDETSILCTLDNEYGQGNLKKLAKPFGEMLGTSRLSEIVESVKDIECAVVTTLRKDKNDPDKKYTQDKEIVVG